MSDRPSIVIATLLRGDGATGVETHIREVVAAARDRGESVSVVTPFCWVNALALPVFGVRMAIDRVSGAASVGWYRYWHYQFLRLALRRRLADSPNAVVYAHCPLSARAALRARRWPSQTVTMAVHFETSQADEWADKRRISRDGRTFRAIRRVESRVLPALDRIVYVSNSARRALTGWLPALREVPSAIVPNFVPASVPRAPRHPGLRDLISVGTLEPAKNHDFLLRVLAAANRLGRRYRLDIVGEGPWRPHLEKHIAALGLKDQVRLLGHRSDVRTLLCRYRAYVHGSTREVLGLAVIEAMAAGLPVVTTAVGGLPEIIDSGAEGLFWSDADAEGAARMLIALLEDDVARARMAAAARARFERDLAAEVAAPRLLDFLLVEDTDRPAAETPASPAQLAG
jgi:glycosyltransferase involved in cell wall biosynthesis